MKKFIALAVLSASVSAFAQVSPVEGLQTTTIDKKTSEKVWRSMKTKTNGGSECFNRAMAWMYDMNKQYGIVGKKYLIHYTKKYNKEISSKWGFHIAPMVNVDGEDMVFDKGFPQWINKPITKAEWEDVFLGHGIEELIELRKKFTKKIRDKEEDIRDKEQDIRELDRTSEWYYDTLRRYKSSIRSYKEKIREYEGELKYLKVSDAEVAEWVRVRNAEITAELAEIEEKLQSRKSDKRALNKRKSALNLKLRKIKADPDQAIDIRCGKITHIEELDYDKSGEYCFMQEISMYYWGIPQLRLLNYGPGYGMNDLPATNAQLRDARERGKEYVRTSFDMEQVWDAREEAFDNYKKQWKAEYEAKKAQEKWEREAPRRAREEARRLKKEEERKKKEAEKKRKAEEKRKKEEAKKKKEAEEKRLKEEKEKKEEAQRERRRQERSRRWRSFWGS
jgi:hypothetical protein